MLTVKLPQARAVTRVTLMWLSRVEEQNGQSKAMSRRDSQRQPGQVHRSKGSKVCPESWVRVQSWE